MEVQSNVTVTGGREATLRHIMGDAALSVCMPPNQQAPHGWSWVPLVDLARMESGHTPSRRHPEYWEGDIPWIAVGDAGRNHGGVIEDTVEHTNQLGIDNSSARLLPTNTVCLSRGGTVGYVVRLGKPMATSQGFANWICGNELDPKFLQYLLLAEEDALDRFAIGTTIKTIYYPDIKALHVCIPKLPEQQRIVGKLDAAFAAFTEAQAHVERNRGNARELFESYLNGVFTEDGSTNTELRVLGEVVDFEGGSQPPKSEFIYEPRAGYVRFLQIRDFKRDDKVTFIPIAKKNRTCEENDVLIGRYGASVGNILSGRAGAYNVALVKTKPSKAITRDYLYFYLLSRLFQDALKKVADRSAQDGFSKDDIFNFPVPLPSIAEQDILCKKFNEILRESNELETTYQQKLSELASLKKAVLGAAFRGEL